MPQVTASRFSPRLLFGLLVMAAGVVLTLDNMDIVRIHHVWKYWPAVLVLMGLSVVVHYRGGRRVLGAVLAFVGTVRLLENLDVLDFDVWDLWPLAIVAAGLVIVWRSFAASRGAGASLYGGNAGVAGNRPPGMVPGAAQAGPAGAGAADSTDSFLRVFTVFGTVRRALPAQQFTGAELSAFFASCEIDLRSVSLAGQATADIAAAFASIHVRVPADWTVGVDGNFVGGIEVQTQAPQAPGRTLRIHGFAPLANVRVTN